MPIQTPNLLLWTVKSFGLIGKQLPEKYKENFNVSSEGPSSEVSTCPFQLMKDWRSFYWSLPDERRSLETSHFSCISINLKQTYYVLNHPIWPRRTSHPKPFWLMHPTIKVLPTELRGQFPRLLAFFGFDSNRSQANFSACPVRTNLERIILNIYLRLNK
jgi:hypothetical protein